MRINVFTYEDSKVYPLYVSKEKYNDEMNLLIITNDNNKHYVLIKDFNSLMYHQTKNKDRKHFCMSCLQCFSKEEKLKKHREVCMEINRAQSIEMPSQGESIKFIGFNKEREVPFVIYEDFESVTKKVIGCKKNDSNSYIYETQRHEESGYGYKLVCHYDEKFSKPVQVYRGKDSVTKFLERMLEEVWYCKNTARKIFKYKSDFMKGSEMLEFRKSKKCYNICNVNYKKGDMVIPDYCQLKGNFKGSAHDICLKSTKIDPDKIKIPVVFHNLRGYDGHLIMQRIRDIAKKHSYKNKNGKVVDLQITAIPNDMERYMCFPTR